MRHETGKRVGIYLALTLVLSCIFWALAIVTGRSAGGHGLYAIGLMWCPGVAALLTCRLCKIPVTSLGWSWGSGRYELIGYLVPLAYAGIAYSIIWTTGLGSVPSAAFVEKTRQSLMWPDVPSWLVIAGYFLLLGTVGVVATGVNALGEEIGWRGFLAPYLTARFGFTVGALLTGALHAAWHLPILLFADYNGATPWYVSLPCFAILVMAVSFVWTWLRLKSGSLWPAVVLHASHNTFVQGFFTPITAAQGTITAYAVDEFGFALPLVAILFAFAFWRNRRQVDNKLSAAHLPNAVAGTR